MKKNCFRLCVSAVILGFCSLAVFPWGSATHAYIDDHLGKNWARQTLNQQYGGMAPDIFNYLFSSSHLEDMYVATHYQYMQVWEEARSVWGRALAFGFVSHNDEWGADFTAHHSGITVGIGEGYVIAKAKLLLDQIPFDPALGLSPEQEMSLYHNFVESGLDVLMKRVDPMIGQKIVAAAVSRSPEFPMLLVRAYGREFAPYFGGYPASLKAIVATESEFRKTMMAYGQALMQDEDTAVQLLAEQMADLAEGFLGGPLPITREQVVGIIAQLTKAAMEFCAQDFSQELKATISFVDQQLKVHGINY